MVMDKCPEISVIVPVYNAKPFLEECLDSILSQRDADFEVIVVDDGSTDGSGAICDRYQARDARIRIVHIPNGGTYPARNRAMDLCRGEFLVFVDADDFLEPDSFRLLLQAQRASGADFVRARYRMVYDKNIPATFTGGIDYFAIPKRSMAYIDDIDGKSTVCFFGGTSVALTRLDLLRRHNLRFRDDVLSGGDAYLCLRIAEVEHKYGFLDKEIYNYRRQTRNSLTSTYSPTKARRMREAIGYYDVLIKHLEKNDSRERVSAAMGNPYTNAVIRYLVVCAADHLATGDPAAFARFREMFESALPQRFLPHYDSRSHAGKSWLLPWLMRFRLTRAAFALCRYKARKRYSRELAALAENRR